jgi:hypothetical protein
LLSSLDFLVLFYQEKRTTIKGSRLNLNADKA